MPSEMQKLHPNLWVNEYEEGGKNLNERSFLMSQLKRNQLDLKFNYSKITNLKAGRELVAQIQNHQKEDLFVLVYNFVDMISHAKTEMEIIKELFEFLRSTVLC